MTIIEARTFKSMLTKEGWLSSRDLIKDDTFKDLVPRKLFAIYKELHDSSDGDLTEEDVGAFISASVQLKRDLVDQLLGAMQLVACETIDNHEAFSITLRRMVEKQKALEAADYISVHVDDPNFDLQRPLKLLQQAEDAGTTLEADVVDFREAPPPGMEDRTGVVGLGLGKKIDMAMGGGVGIGDFMVLMAPSGMGKTSNLVLLGTHMAKLGCNVCHISLEDHGHKIQARYDTTLTNLTYDELIESPTLVMERRRALPGNIYIQDWSHKDVKASDVRSLLMRMAKRGKRVDVVIIDYIGKMSPDAKIMHNEAPYAKVAEEVRRVSNELKFRTLTGWQTNRGGFDENVLAAKDTGKDIGVFQECDGMIGITQSHVQREEKTATYAVMKSRGNTYRPVLPMNVDYDRMIITQRVSQATPEIGPKDIKEDSDEA